MFRKHKSKRRFIAFILVAILIFTLVDYKTTLFVSASQSGGGSDVTKTATEKNREERIYELKFTADMESIFDENKKNKPIDVILLVDMSTSMWEKVGDTGITRLQVMKDVATDFVDKLADFSSDSTLGIATFYSSSDLITNSIRVNSEDNIALLKEKIDGIDFKEDQPSGTHHDYGLIRAEEILQAEPLASSTNQKYIILLTDGQPNPYPLNRDTAIDQVRFPEIYNNTSFTYYDISLGEYRTATTDQIKSKNVMRDLCVARIVDSIKDMTDDTIKFATVGFEITDTEVQHTQALFDVVTGVDLATNTPIENREKYQFWTNSETTLDSVFDKLLEGYSKENATDYEVATVIDYIEADFVPLDDDENEISVDSARAGVTLDNGAIVRYDDEKNLYYVIWGQGTVLDMTSGWSSSVYIKAKNDLIGGPNIPTNVAGSGIYGDGELIVEFTIPTVDVYIRKYNVTHEFVSGTMGMDLPQSVNDLLPADLEDVDDGSVVSPTNPAQTEVVVDGGIWKLEGWDAANKTIEHTDQEFVGTWVYEKTYDVTHTFVSGTLDMELPYGVMELLPTDQTGKRDGSQVSPTALSHTEVEVRDGKWTFVEWDAANKTIEHADQEFVGTWVYTENPKYDVKHEFVSGTPDMELPNEVMALLPPDQTGFKDGSAVRPTPVSQKVVEVEDGKWTFVEWDETQKGIEGDHQTFTGTWVYTENPKYDVKHEFVSGTPDMELPDEVKALLPADQTGFKDGSEVNPTAPSQTVVEVEDGKWTFVEWDADEKIINGTNQTFTGTWVYTEDPKYDVKHEFVSGTPDKELPDEVKALLPADQTGKKDGSEVSPTELSQMVVEDEDGRWVFRTWDADKKTISGAGQTFVGTWEYVPNPTYDVKHEFISGTSDKELPDEVKALLPTDQLGLKDGSEVNPTAPSQTVVEVEDGKWTFVEWDETQKTINGAHQTFTGTWVYTENPKYDVKHEFISGTTGKELPESVKNLTPANQTGLKDGSEVNPTAPSQTVLEVEDGKWTFVEWDADEKIINGTNQIFTGTWVYTENPKYDVKHEFISGTQDKELPDEVMALLPPDQTGKKDGSEVSPTPLSQMVVEVEHGKWTFVEWDADKKTISGARQTFVGTWEYVPNPTYDVKHEFISGTQDKELPDEVKALLPPDQTGKKDGSAVSPTPLSQKVVEVEDGKWTFVEWDETQKAINGAHQTFTGTWVYSENPKYDVTHEFVSGTSGKELPDEVKALLPPDQTGKKDGSKVNPSEPLGVEVEDADGRWIFRTWDEDEKTISGSNQKFVGTWEYVPNPSYDVIHEFVSGTPGKELPNEVKELTPPDQLGIKDGIKVNPTTPSQTVVEVEDGKWIFEGWDAEDKIINGADERFKGTWTYEENPKYDVIHEFVSGTPGKELPNEVKELTPPDQLGIKDGIKVNPTTPSQTVVEAEDGKWIFEGWDAEDKIINGADERFKGTWTYEENPKYDVIHEFVSGTPNKELPDEVRELLPTNQTGKKDGSKVNPSEPLGVEVEDADGRWIFRTWDEDEKIISGSNQKFIGTWEYVPNPSYDVIHEFVSGTPGKELPDEVIELILSDQLGFKDGTKVNPTTFSQIEVFVEDGKWIFKGWDAAEKIIAGSDQNFVGTWVFIATVPDEPEDPSEPGTPPTGDSTNANVWYLVSLISLLIMVYMVLKKNALKKINN